MRSAKIIGASARDEDEQRRLREMEARGLIRVGSGKLPRGFWDAPRPADPAGEVRRALLEEREESR